MKITNLYLLLFVLCNASIAQKNNLHLQKIPDSLLYNANAINRLQQTKLQIAANGKATEVHKNIVTILNAKGEDNSVFVEYTDKFTKIQDLSIKVYDNLGFEIAKYGKKQAEKLSNFNDDNLVSDGQLFFLKVPIKVYPVTIITEYEIAYKGYLKFDDIQLNNENKAIQEIDYTVETTADNPLRYKNYNTTVQPTVTNNGNTLIYNWHITNIRAIENNKNDDDTKTIYPHIAITPTTFMMDGYEGSFASWNAYGNWYKNLSLGKNVLSDQQQKEVLALVKPLKTEREKIATLYTYLQKNYRYVSIQLGIGGFMPMTAVSVHKLKYGDCKALSNYMQTILQVAGIESYQALINAGSKALPVDINFANHKFNHVILCVPNHSDTVWLECTSNDNEYGTLGSFTENRFALLVTDTGGVLVPTPLSKANNNSIVYNNVVTINNDLTATATNNIIHSGYYNKLYTTDVWMYNDADLRNFLLNEMEYKPFDAFEIIKQKELKQTKLQFTYTKIFSFNAGLTYFLPKHNYALWQKVLPANNNPTTDYNLVNPFVHIDTTLIHLPPTFTLDQLPKPTQLSCPNAKYFSNIIYNNLKNTITVITHLQLQNQMIKATDYQKTKQFFDAVIEDCKMQIPLKRNE